MGLIYNDSEIIWKVYYKWMTKRIDCTHAGITNGCRARCCYGPTYWPGRVNSGAHNECYFLSEVGCTLTFEDRPVTCHLYPLIAMTDRLILHFKALNGCCKKCYRKGPMVIDAIEKNMRFLFGNEQYERVSFNVKLQKNSYIIPPKSVVESLIAEHTHSVNDTIPTFDYVKEPHGKKIDTAGSIKGVQ